MTRIICPACQATYDVPATAIPAGGREVQCSACGHNWYQLWAGDGAGGGADVAGDAAMVADRPGVAAQRDGAQGNGAMTGEERLERMRRALRQPDAADANPGFATRRASLRAMPLDDGDTEDETGPPSGFSEAPSPALRRRFTALGDIDAAGDAAPTQAADSTAPVPGFLDEEPELDLRPPPKRKISPDVLEVLRSEAAVEARARRRDVGAPLERQDELPLVQRPRRSAADVRARLARLKDAEQHGGAPARWTENADLPTDPAEPDPVSGSAATSDGFPPLPPLAEMPPSRKTPRPGPAFVEPAFVEPEVAEHVASDAARERMPMRRSEPGLPARMSSRELAAYEVRQARRGFRIGFAAPVAVAAVAVGLYLAAPRIMEHLPQTAPALSGVVEQGDLVQETLAARILATLERLSGQDES